MNRSKPARPTETSVGVASGKCGNHQKILLRLLANCSRSVVEEGRADIPSNSEFEASNITSIK